MLTFALGSIPIRVHLSFWITAAMLGVSGNPKPADLALWVAGVFVSVLLHELGHALMGKVFDLAPQIELYAFGGGTSWQGGNELSSGPRILVSLAGPLAGLALAGVLYFTALSLADGDGMSPVVDRFVNNMLWINLVWSIFNLLPILPLDGGNVMAHTLAAFTDGGGRRAAHVISIVVAAAIALYMFVRGGLGNIFPIVFLALFAVQNAKALGAIRDAGRPGAPSHRPGNRGDFPAG
ncbi:site-2 protease family protein [Pendulispora albinea]|uniref:Site-2 protease family protein n=1 Tax=Pendulispora albinea TaxID=2741071 RepID=A0ABZ2LR43_9BACT